MPDYKRVILVHYHEIGLKGHNRPKFEKKLVNNIKQLKCNNISSINRMSGRIVLYLNENCDRDSQIHVCDIIKKVPGVQRVSAGFVCDPIYSNIKDLSIEALVDVGEFETFKVQARRNHTDFEPNSEIMNHEIGAVLCEGFPTKKVKMKDCDVVVSVEVVQNKAFVCAFTESGVGGLPVGVSGKIMCMLSSGIDSPVATWRMAKRGASCVGVHFSGRPQTSSESEYLVGDIAKVLSESGCLKEYWICPIGDYQREISLKAISSLRVILYRRLMFRVTEELGLRCGAKAIATGESLGQVASQTIENMTATQDAVTIPVLRPLIGMDKLEIISQAEDIGTYEISTNSAPDCCTLFMPKSPETHANLEVVREQESLFPIEKWVGEIVESAERFVL